MWHLPVFLTMLLILSPAASGGGPDPFPSTLSDQHGLFWVDAATALTSSGELKEDVLGPRATARLVEAATENKTLAERTGTPGCHVFIGTVPKHFEPTGSLGDLVTHADSIVDGTVTEVREGFLSGHPGSLLRLSASHLKGLWARNTYLFIPIARIPTKEGPVCASARFDFSAPRVGDRYIVFKMTPPLVTDHALVLIVDTARELAQLAHDGSVRLPESIEHYGADSAPFDELRSDIESLLTENGFGTPPDRD